VEQGEATFVSQALAALPSGVSFFGKVVGFTVNFTPDALRISMLMGTWWRPFQRHADRAGLTRP
jgi:hypothetical protein